MLIHLGCIDDQSRLCRSTSTVYYDLKRLFRPTIQFSRIDRFRVVPAPNERPTITGRFTLSSPKSKKSSTRPDPVERAARPPATIPRPVPRCRRSIAPTREVTITRHLGCQAKLKNVTLPLFSKVTSTYAATGEKPALFFRTFFGLGAARRFDAPPSKIRNMFNDIIKLRENAGQSGAMTLGILHRGRHRPGERSGGASPAPDGLIAARAEGGAHGCVARNRPNLASNTPI